MSKRKIIVIAIIIIPVLIFIYFNVIKPCEINENKIEIFISRDDENLAGEEYDDEIFNALIDRYEGKNSSVFFNDEQLVRKNRNLPSDKTKDYGTVIISVEFKNNSIFNLKDIIGSVTNEKDDSYVLYSTGAFVSENIKPLKTKKDTEIIWLTMYMGDMSDEEILDYIQRLDIEVYYSSKMLGSNDEIISLKHAKLRK